MKIENRVQKERLVYLDFIKTFAIYLVCLYHFNNFKVDFLGIEEIGLYRNYFLKGIASTAVPLFLMVNGHLMLNSTRKVNLKKHSIKIVRTILITFIWSIILMNAAIIIKGNQYTSQSFWYSISILESGTLNQLWYIYALICIYILYPVIKNMYDNEDKSLIYYFLIVVSILTFGNVLINIGCNIYEYIKGYNVYIDHNYNYFNFSNVFRAIPAYTFVYFIVGAFVGKYIEHNSDKIKIQIPILIWIIGQSLLFAYGVMMTKSNGTTFDIVFGGYNTVMTFIMSVSIFIVAFKLDYILKKIKKVLYIIGDNTLGIYFIHAIVGWGLINKFKAIPKSTNIFMNLGFGIVVMGISLIISLIIKRMPILKNLLKI